MPKNILISEIQINPIAQRFVELYNPGSTDINLTGWYLQRKTQGATSWISFISSTNFADKIISAHSYFLISRQLSGSDILFPTMTLSNDNSLALKKSDGTIIDKVGYGAALDFETASTVNPLSGKSISREPLSDGTEQDTDNNLNDFELAIPTPRAQNQIILSSDDTITSTVYKVSSLEKGAGTISGILYLTAKEDFESYLTPAMRATLDFSGISDPVASGDTLTVTAQDGTTKAIYTITVDTTPYSQGAIDSFTTDGKFVFHTSDFMPNQMSWCGFSYGIYKGTYPSEKENLGNGSGPCANSYPSWSVDMSHFILIYNQGSTVGEYDFYISYCGGQNCNDKYNSLGDYYRMYFNGSAWSSLSNTTGATLSSDATLTVASPYTVGIFSPVYTTGGIFVGGTGTIVNVPYATSKADFESLLTPATGAILDFSGVNDTVSSGDVVNVTAQNGVAKSIYTITVNAPVLSSNDKITSSVYTIDQTGLTIIGIPFATSKSDFEKSLTKDESDQIWDDSGIEDPVASGDTLTVTAQDGTTKAIYTISVDAAPPPPDDTIPPSL